MKALILFAFLFTSFSSLALEQKFPIVLRSDDNAAIVDLAVLSHLESESAFDGTHFKIVKGKDEHAVRFDAEEELVFRAATAYFHLEKARDYFINSVNSDFVKAMPKMIIRIDHKNQFSELGHFAHDNLEPQFNNALTIPSGKGLASRGIKPWGVEIWFRPAKRIHLRDLKVKSDKQQEMKVLMQSFRNQIHMQSLQNFLTASVLALSAEGYQLSTESVVRSVGASLIIEAGYQFIDPLSRAFSRKWYWLDSALVPDIIYHEFAHAALSDHLVLSHSTAVIEGMADFFAGQIADSPTLAKKIKQHNTFNGKNALRKQNYVIQFEQTEYANTDFVFGLLWEMKKIVGDEKGAEFMYELRKRISTNSTVRGQLIEGLLKTCDEKCDLPFNDKLRILKALNLRGI